MDPEGFTALLRRARLLPVLRTATASEAVAATDRLADAGVAAVELTATTRDWPAALRDAVAAHPAVRVGLGTVWEARTAARAAELGAAFLVAPGSAPEARAASAGLPFLEGGWTPSELRAASRHGPAKLFPASVGGPAHLRAMRAVLPDRELVPTGGIRLADVPRWLEAGALAVGVGTDLLAAPDLPEALAAATSAEPAA